MAALLSAHQDTLCPDAELGPTTAAVSAHPRPLIPALATPTMHRAAGTMASQQALCVSASLGHPLPFQTAGQMFLLAKSQNYVHDPRYKVAGKANLPHFQLLSLGHSLCLP